MYHQRCICMHEILLIPYLLRDDASATHVGSPPSWPISSDKSRETLSFDHLQLGYSIHSHVVKPARQDARPIRICSTTTYRQHNSIRGQITTSISNAHADKSIPPFAAASPNEHRDSISKRTRRCSEEYHEPIAVWSLFRWKGEGQSLGYTG
jgi:hypothetical protein